MEFQELPQVARLMQQGIEFEHNARMSEFSKMCAYDVENAARRVAREEFRYEQMLAAIRSYYMGADEWEQENSGRTFPVGD